MPKQYTALKQQYGAKKAAKIYIGRGKTEKARSERAKRIKHK